MKIFTLFVGLLAFVFAFMKDHNRKQSGDYSIEWYNIEKARLDGEIIFQADQLLITRFNNVFKVYLPEDQLYLNSIRKTIEADIKVETILNLDW